MILPADYVPSSDEDFMNPQMREYFRLILEAKANEASADLTRLRRILNNETPQTSEIIDRALESEARITLERDARRASAHLTKIKQVLGLIKEGSYGYCEDTGEPIGVRRLLARPETTLSIEAKEAREKNERLYNPEAMGSAVKVRHISSSQPPLV